MSLRFSPSNRSGRDSRVPPGYRRRVPSRTLIHVCDYGAPYLGNFLPSQLRVGDAVRERMGLDFRFVFPTRAQGRPWLEEIDRRGFGFDFLEKERSRPSRAARLRAIARRHGAAILHSHYFTFDIDCAIAAAGRGAGVVWHVRNGIERYTIKNRASDLVKVRLLGRRCDVVMCVSEAAARDSRYRGFPDSKVRVVLNGIVLDRFADPPDVREVVRSRLGIDPAATVLLSFCWTPDRKGTDLVIRAVERLVEGGGPPVVLVVTGEAEMRTFVREMMGDDLPSWLVLTDPLEDVAELFVASDVFVSAAREDAFSYAIGEAMACRLPVVTSDIPGPSHYFAAEGVTTFPSEDLSALRAALEEVLSATDRVGRGERNKEYVERQLSVESYVDRVLAVYNELLSARRRRPPTQTLR